MSQTAGLKSYASISVPESADSGPTVSADVINNIQEALEECLRSGYQGKQDLAAVAIYQIENGRPTRIALIDRFCGCDSGPDVAENRP